MERDSKASAGRLAEVWNDTVDLRHLAWAIAIGIAVSVAGFYAASGWLRDKVASPELAHAYAMLAGLAGCVLAGVICARLFPPKREVVEHSASHDPAWRAEVLAELAAQPGGLGTLADLPPDGQGIEGTGPVRTVRRARRGAGDAGPSANRA